MSVYESFRTVLTLNLCSVVQDPEILRGVLSMVDMTLDDYEITRKPMDLISSAGVPEVAKLYIASKSISGRSAGTLKQYSYKLMQFFDSVKKSYLDITPNDIRLYLHRYKAEHGSSDRYIDNIRRTLSGFFQWLVDNEYIPRNPCARVEPIKYKIKPREPLTDYQLEDFRWHCENLREKALADFFYSTGCRVSECAEIRLSDIDWPARTVRIRNGKGGKERFVCFNAESELSLRKYLESRSDSTDALFVSVRAPHQAIGPHALENILKKISSRAGLRVFPHRLRHTFATVGLRNGIPLDKLQQLLGHESPQTTLIYAKEDRAQIRMEHLRAFS